MKVVLKNWNVVLKNIDVQGNVINTSMESDGKEVILKGKVGNERETRFEIECVFLSNNFISFDNKENVEEVIQSIMQSDWVELIHIYNKILDNSQN